MATSGIWRNMFGLLATRIFAIARPEAPTSLALWLVLKFPAAIMYKTLNLASLSLPPANKNCPNWNSRNVRRKKTAFTILYKILNIIWYYNIYIYKYEYLCMYIYDIYIYMVPPPPKKTYLFAFFTGIYSVYWHIWGPFFLAFFLFFWGGAK